MSAVESKETLHSPWGASVSHRFFACPGSVNLCKTVPNLSSPFAREGTAAHLLGAKCLATDTNAADHLETIITVEGEDFPVTDEMAEAVQLYLDTVRLDKVTLGGQLLIEHEFNLESVRPGLFGTADAVLLTADLRCITYDYKHGAGVAVDVDTPQLKYYTLGTLLANDRKKRKIVGAEGVLVQPRCSHRDGPVRRQEYELMDLLDFRADLGAAVDATMPLDAPLVAGEHCKFCPARAVCPAQHALAQQVAAMDFANVVNHPPSPASLTIEQLEQVMARASQVEDWLSEVRALTHRLLEAGTPVRGWKLVQKRPVRYWKDETEAPGALAVLGLNDDEMYKPRELISPAQAEGILKGKAGKTALAPLWEKRSSGTTIAPEMDRRAGIAPSAQTDFAGFVENQGQEQK